MSQRLPRRIGLLAAKEMMFSGRVVNGNEAVKWVLLIDASPTRFCWRDHFHGKELPGKLLVYFEGR